MRNPKPEALKDLTGTGQRSRARAAFAFPHVETLAPPTWLKGTHALAEWDRVTKMLAASKALTPADQTTLAHACAAHDLALRAELALGDDLTQTNEKGMSSANPLVSIAEHARNQYLRYASEFGLSPRARRLGLGPAEEKPKADSFDEFMGGD